MKKLLTGKTFLFAFCVLLALLTNWIFGVHFGEASENYWVSRWVQEYPKGSAILNLELFLYGISYPIYWLSSLNHNVNFLAVFLWLANLWAVFLVLETVSHRLKHVRNYVFVAFFFLVLFAENFVFIDLTRSAISLSFAGILFGVYNQGKKPRIVVAIISISIGLCIRPAVGYLGLVFFFLILLSKYFYGFDVWEIRKRLIPILLTLVCFMGLQTITKNKDFASSNKLRSQVYDREYDISNIKELEHQDVELFSNGFVGFNHLQESFYGKLAVSLSSDKKLSKLKNDVLVKLDYYPYVFLLLVVMLLPLVKKRMYLVSLLWLISLIVLSVFYKLPNRVFYPYAGMFLLMILMVYPESFKIRRGWIKAVLIIVLGLSLGKLGLRSKHTLESQFSNDDQYYGLIEEAKGNYLFVSGIRHFTQYLNPFKNYGEKELKGLIGLKGWPTLLPGYSKTLDYTFGYKEYAEIFTDPRYKEKTLFLLDKEDVKILTYYIQTIKGKTINLVEESSLNSNMGLYRLN